MDESARLAVLLAGEPVAGDLAKIEFSRCVAGGDHVPPRFA